MKTLFAFLLFPMFFLNICICTISAEEAISTGWSDFPPTPFEQLHSPIGSDDNAALLLGAIPVTEPAADIPPELAVFSGRWEGYDLSPPVPGDMKVVMVVTSITRQGGTAVLWSAPDFHLTYDLKHITFAFRENDDVELYFDAIWEPSKRTGGMSYSGQVAFRYDPSIEGLKGTLSVTGSHPHPIELQRGNTFVTYRDYDRYLEQLGIHTVLYEDKELRADGDGWLVYLPPEYGDDPERRWPLIYFFHGSGDTGMAVSTLAKASPFMYIRQGHTLPAIIIAPALRNYLGTEYHSFPPEYLVRVLEKAKSMYRIDEKRVSVTGLSMGGEATFRFALEYPHLVSTAVPLCFGDPAVDETFLRMGFKPFPRPYSRAAEIPFWVIQGTDDVGVPANLAIKTVEAMEAEGMNVKFSLLKGYGHDVWTDTYSDAAFYEWLLAQSKPGE